MTIKHHPSDATLAAYASGTLDQARGLVVATHLSLCAQCRVAVNKFESVGGAVLEDSEPVTMSSGALQRAMAALGPLEIIQPTIGGENPPEFPEPLSRYAMGPWRWIGRGVQWRAVDVASDDGVRVFMLKAVPGTRLPRHRDRGRRRLWGSFRAEGVQAAALPCAADGPLPRSRRRSSTRTEPSADNG